MKISQKQANLLAREIHKKLEKQNVVKISDSQRNQLTKFYNKREELKNNCSLAEKALETHDNSIRDISTKLKNVSVHNGMKYIIGKLEESEIPSLFEIENKIILKGMFSKDEELEDFIQSIVKEYTKKKPVAVN